MLQSLGQHFKEGGWGMWPIVFWMVFVVAITVERSMYLFKSSINKDAFLSNIQKCILAGDVGRAIKLCSSAQAPLARIVKAGMGTTAEAAGPRANEPNVGRIDV